MNPEPERLKTMPKKPARKKATTKPRSKAKAKPPSKAARAKAKAALAAKSKPQAQAPEVDEALLKTVENLCDAVADGSIIGVVIIPIQRDGTNTQFLMPGRTPPGSLALALLMLQRAVVDEAMKVARKAATLQQAKAELEATEARQRMDQS